MSWTYQQNSGKLLDPEGRVIGIGYAGGDCGLQPLGKNNPAMENIPNVGPLPAGNYTADWMVQVHPKLGRYVIHLAPDAETAAKIDSYGRASDSFFCHGDNISSPGNGSDGCIVQSLDVRTAFWESVDHGLIVVSGEL
jgi:hypothetical protein